MEDAPGLDRQKEAAAAVSPHVAATESRPEYAIGPDVSRAFADYMDYRENRDTGRKWGSLDEYLRQGDMLDQRSEIAESVMRLLDAPNGAALLAETARLYAEAAKGEGEATLFGAPRTRAELWRDAAKTVDPARAERRYSLAKGTVADYSWATLSAKEDMKLAKIEGDREYGDDVARRLADARESVLKAGGRKENNHYLIDIEGEPVEVGKRGILHGWHNRNNDFIYPVLGEVLKNAVRVNELDVREELTGKGEKDDQVLAKFVYLGAAVDGNKIFPVRIQIDQKMGRRQVGEIDVLKSVNAKSGEIASPAEADLTGLTRSNALATETSIANLIRIAQPLHPQIFSRDVAAALGSAYRGGEIGARYSVSGVYTGSAADYANRSRVGGKDDGPTLVKIGTGEGSQVYGWGLYGSTVRGVAESYETYRDSDHAVIVVDGNEWKPKANAPIGQRTAYEQLDDFANSPEEIAQYCESMEGAHYKAAAKFIRSHKIEIREPHTYLYQQTFFTDRAPGDESHLLKWYEPVSKETWDIIREAERANGTLYNDNGTMLGLNQGYVLERDGKPSYPKVTGQSLYETLAKELGSPQAASEFLARAGIDGVKYPVDSFGGKTVKDGDVAGWNYVSFRDDNIRVDHKWTDGQQRYSIVSLGGRDVAVVDDLEAARAMNPTMPADVEKYILDHLEDGIRMLVGGTADVNAETARHFAWSAVRGKYGSNRRMRKARAQSAVVFRDLVEMFTADATTKQNDYHGKGDDIWVCRLPFGVPQFGNSSEKVEGGIVYDADVIVKDQGNGKYLYDVSNLERNEALTQQLTAQAQGLFDGRKRAAEAVSARAPSEALAGMLGGLDRPAASASTPRIVPNPAGEIKRDPEAFARRSVIARVEAASDDAAKMLALEAFVAERALRHGPKPNAIKTVARLGLEMGLKTVDVKRIMREGEALAERMRGTVIENAARNGDVATAISMLAREGEIDRLVAGGAEAGGKLVKEGHGRIRSIIDTEVEKAIRSFRAASLADVERDTGIDIAGEILMNDPEKFDPRPAKKSASAGSSPSDASDAEGPVSGAGAPGDAPLSDYEVARRLKLRKEAEARVKELIATAKERAEKARRRREEREAKRKAAQAAGGGAGQPSGEGGDGVAPGDTSPGESAMPETFADFKSPEEFAAFFRVWSEQEYKKTQGTTTLGKHEEKRLFPEFYRKAAVKELQDLADKLLPPKGARATVNRWLGEIQPGAKPDMVERVSADIFRYINKNAIRESRSSMIRRFRSDLKPFCAGKEFDDLKVDSDRAVTGAVEEAARYIRRVCELSDKAVNGELSALDRERERLMAIIDRREKVYDDSGKEVAEAPKSDMETRRALQRLQLLEKYGAMQRLMPGEIAALADEAMHWLHSEAAELAKAWHDARQAEKDIRTALAAAIVGPNGQRYQRPKGVWGATDRLFDSMNGMIRLRLHRLLWFAPKGVQEKGRDAVNRVMVMLGDGEVAFSRAVADDRQAFNDAIAKLFPTADGKRVDRRAAAEWLNRMTEPIPQELSRRLSTQGFKDRMTYGQMLQLLVSLEQKSYADSVKANSREGQAELIRSFETVGPDGRRERVLSEKDILFIDWLRSFYEAKRAALSEVTKRMTGLPIDSPDPLYCPVKMYMGDVARGLHVDPTPAWDPIGSVFTRRQAHVLRDFDEQATILGQFFDRSAASAKLVAWGERGSIIRGVFTDPAVQQAVRLAYGGGELSAVLKQLEETFNGGEGVKKTPGELAAMDKAMNWMTYMSLGYNPLSAAKQTTSFTVWANALPGGFRDLWRYMTDVDMDTVRHIRESDEFRVRYGNEVGSGHDVASKGLFENPSDNPLAAFFRKSSMYLLRKGDFLPGGWIAQGLFRDLYNRHLKEGMAPEAADRLAMSETFNMLEETQQSGRTYNTQALVREHGRLGRLLVQFATSPLQQLQYETQAAREVADLRRYRPVATDPDFEKRYAEAKGRFVRAFVINHVMLPAALHAVTNLYRAAMGIDPEWEKEGWHWTLLRDLVAGQFSRVFFLGAISSVTTDVLITGKPVRDVPALIPAEGVVKLLGNVTLTARDIATLNYEQIQKDLHRLLKSTSITRTPYDVIRRVTGNSDADDKRRRKSR